MTLNNFIFKSESFWSPKKERKLRRGFLSANNRDRIKNYFYKSNFSRENIFVFLGHLRHIRHEKNT